MVIQKTILIVQKFNFDLLQGNMNTCYISMLVGDFKSA